MNMVARRFGFIGLSTSLLVLPISEPRCLDSRKHPLATNRFDFKIDMPNGKDLWAYVKLGITMFLGLCIRWHTYTRQHRNRLSQKYGKLIFSPMASAIF